MIIRYYLKGFVASFVSFALQFFIIKIAQFYYNEIQLSLLFSIFSLGFAAGAMLVLFDSKKRNLDFFWLAVTFLAFIFSFHFSTDRSVFYISVFIIFLPLGYVIASGITKAPAAKFYFCDLLGGAAGILYAFLSIGHISIETSIILFASVASVFGVVESYLSGSKRAINTVALLMCGGLLGIQTHGDVFNLMRWSKDIAEPSVRVGHSAENAFRFLKSDQGELILSKWSLIDRIDIVHSATFGLTAYANNTLWTGIVGNGTLDNFPFLAKSGNFGSVLAIGYGGGEDFKTAKRLEAASIVGVEMNEALVNILNNELSYATSQILEGVELVTNDARFYLNSEGKQFDLIINRYTDHRGKSARYLTHYNLLRTYDSIELILKRLTDRGIVIWTVNGDDLFKNSTVTNLLIASQNFLSKRGISQVNRHFAIFKGEVGAVASTHGGTFHIVFSMQPVSPELLKKYFNDRYENIYPPVKENHAISALMGGLSNVSNRAQLNKYLEHIHGGGYSSLSDNKPIYRNSTSIYLIFGNLLLCTIVIMILFLLAFMKKESGSDGTLGRMAVATSTGFVYGLLEAALIQEIEYYTPIIAVGYGVTLCLFLVSGGLASLLGTRWSARMCYLAYFVVPLISVVWLRGDVLTMLPWYWAGLMLFFYFVAISLLFPKLLESQKIQNTAHLPLLISVNLIGLTMGGFAFCMYFLSFGRSDVSLLVLSTTLIGAVIVLGLLKTELLTPTIA